MSEEESEIEFLARLRPPFITKEDKARLARMMAKEAMRRGDIETAERLNNRI